MLTSTILLFSSSAVAEEPVSAPVAVPHPRARVGRGIGIGLTSVGMVIGAPSLAMTVGGTFGLLTCGTQNQPDGCFGPVLLTGVGLIGLGLSSPFLGTGIPLWVVHQKKIKRNRAAKMTVSMLPLLGRRTGVRISGTF